MGGIVSTDIPSDDELEALADAKITRKQLVALKKELLEPAREDGGLSPETWADACDKVGIDEDYATFLYTALDDDGDEWIDFADYATYAALCSGSGPKRRVKKIEYIFRCHDESGDGYLQLNEFEDLVLRVTRTVRRVNGTLPGLTGNAKAGQYKLSTKEEGGLREATSRLMDKIDTNNDDKISYKELQSADKKEIMKVLDYFMAISDALPSGDDEDSGKSSKRSKSSKSKRSKSKRSKSADTSDASDASKSDASEAESKRSKSSKSKRSKRSKSADTSDASKSDASVESKSGDSKRSKSKSSKSKRSKSGETSDASMSVESKSSKSKRSKRSKDTSATSQD